MCGYGPGGLDNASHTCLGVRVLTQPHSDAHVNASSPRCLPPGRDVCSMVAPTLSRVRIKALFSASSSTMHFCFPFFLRKCHNINVKIIIEKEFFLMSLGSCSNYIKPGLLLLVNEILLKLNQLRVNGFALIW